MGQTRNGGISAEMLQQIEKQNPPTVSDRALRNALAANAIDLLAKNHQHAGALDTYFSVETKSQSITDQKSSGRCWMFSGLNVLRSNFAKRTDSLTVTFSQDYLFFWDQLEKANLMLQGVIDTGSKPIDDPRVQFFFHHPLSADWCLLKFNLRPIRLITPLRCPASSSPSFASRDLSYAKC